MAAEMKRAALRCVFNEHQYTDTHAAQHSTEQDNKSHWAAPHFSTCILYENEIEFKSLALAIIFIVGINYFV